MTLETSAWNSKVSPSAETAAAAEGAHRDTLGRWLGIAILELPGEFPLTRETCAVAPPKLNTFEKGANAPAELRATARAKRKEPVRVVDIFLSYLRSHKNNNENRC